MKSPETKAIHLSYVKMHLARVIQSVSKGNRDFLILRYGQPTAVIISVREYLALVKPKVKLESLDSFVTVKGIEEE